MKKIIILLTLMTPGFLFGQVPADSLPGIYVGLLYYSNPYTQPFIVTQDTITVTHVDSVNCYAFYTNSPAHSTSFHIAWGVMYTNYYSCNTSTPSNYTLFYNEDSLKWIFDSIPQPWPNSPYSLRFYGKKIAPYIITGIVSNSSEDEIILIYPNPTKENLNIVFQQSEFVKRYEVITIDSKILKQQILNTNTKQIDFDIGKLEDGIYFIRVETANSVFTKKILVEH